MFLIYLERKCCFMANGVLTEKQKLFALEYLKDLNATRAYKEVYKSCKKTNSARKAGSRLLCNLKVFTAKFQSVTSWISSKNI